MAKIAVIGYGVVGSGTVEVIYKNKKSLEEKAGQEIDVKYIIDLKDFPGSPYKDKFIKDFDIVLNDPEVTVVAEVIGGVNVAYKYTKSALEAGKSVVTSNKELVAAKGAELLKIASEHNVNYFFEASVGGGIPIIRPLHQCLSANMIDEIAGILNGTTNFILTKITEGMDAEEALKLAQKLGYAEANPAADVEGHDACRKICILASLAFGRHVYPEKVHTEGITNVTLEDVEFSKSFGGAVKLIGWASRHENNQVAIMVCPAFVKSDSQLANVNDVFNAILVRGDATGDVVFYGKGAGKLPTASAVVSDIIVAAKMGNTSKSLHWEDSDSSFVIDYKSLSNKFYIRAFADDVKAAEKKAAELFGEITPLTRKNQLSNEIAFITNTISEQKLEDAICEFEKTAKVKNRIRVLNY